MTEEDNYIVYRGDMKPLKSRSKLIDEITEDEDVEEFYIPLNKFPYEAMDLAIRILADEEYNLEELKKNSPILLRISNYLISRELLSLVSKDILYATKSWGIRFWYLVARNEDVFEKLRLKNNKLTYIDQEGKLRSRIMSFEKDIPLDRNIIDSLYTNDGIYGGDFLIDMQEPDLMTLFGKPYIRYIVVIASNPRYIRDYKVGDIIEIKRVPIRVSRRLTYDEDGDGEDEDREYSYEVIAFGSGEDLEETENEEILKDPYYQQALTEMGNIKNLILRFNPIRVEKVSSIIKNINNNTLHLYENLKTGMTPYMNLEPDIKDEILIIRI